MGLLLDLGEELISDVTGAVEDTVETVGSLLHPSRIQEVDVPAGSVPQSTAPQSTLSDLTKMTYKEVYAFYKLAGKGENALPDWQVVRRIDEIHTGLDARVFVNSSTHEINICFEGSHGFTKLLGENAMDGAFAKDLYRVSDGFSRFLTDDEYNEIYDKWHLILGKDGLADLQMMSNKVPDQFYTAYTWFQDTMTAIRNTPEMADYKLVITGHSLGGSMAQMVSAKYYLDTKEAIPTIAIDGTGVLTLVEQMQGAGTQLDTKQFGHIVNFCTDGDPVGDFATQYHLGFTVPIPYDLSRGDRPDALPNYRVFMEAFQKATGIENIRLDRHEIGQQIDLFNNTSFTYPENHTFVADDATEFRLVSGKKEIIMANDRGNTIYGGDESSYLVGATGNDVLYGGAKDDFIAGGAGNDKIYGGEGNNILFGGAGNDTLVGGSGNDELYGGAGDDVLAWTGGNDSLYGQGGKDTYLLGSQQAGKLAAGTVTLKFDRENIENAHVLIDTKSIDTKNSQIVFLMSDTLLPSHTSIAQKDNSLYIQYDANSSLTIDNWSAVQESMGGNISFNYLGDKMQYGVQNNSLVKK